MEPTRTRCWLRTFCLVTEEPRGYQTDTSIETEHRVAILTDNKSTWLDDHVAKQETEAHVEVASFHIHRPKAHLARSARWPYSEFGSPRRSGQLPHMYIDLRQRGARDLLLARPARNLGHSSSSPILWA